MLGIYDAKRSECTGCKQSELTKVHGGAILKTVAYSTKDDNVIVERKNRDARTNCKYAAEQIASGDFVYLDTGTTTELMIEYITSRGRCLADKCDQSCEASGRGFAVYLFRWRVQGSPQRRL